jgi:Doubled CXXCH motif (Paired_CXXCH_1)
LARSRTTKKVAQRIDLNYFKRATPFKRAKLWLSLLLPLAAVIWIGWRAVSRDPRVYSSGRLSEAHAVLERQCSACHLQAAGAFSAKADDKACLACHDGPAHHATSSVGVNALSCAACHSEHRGRVNLVAARNETCAECHANLRTVNSATRLANSICSFESGHPEFAPLRTGAESLPRDPRTIKLNHAIHMKPIRRGPNGPIVQLECGNCHRATAAAPDLTYSDASYRTANVSYKDADEVRPIGESGLKPPKAPSGREYMAPVTFANACAACHFLTFDKRFDFGVPHDKPEVVHAFLIAKFSEYIRAHPTELREKRDPDRDLTGRPLRPADHLFTPAEWISTRVSQAEDLLWRKTCKQCHQIGLSRKDGPEPMASATPSTTTPVEGRLPTIVASAVTLVWMPHAKFDHDAHRGFTCESCHPKALTSSDDSEILLPGVATCQKCHAPGPEHAESRCFECHTYHDWSKRKEIAPKFTLPALRTGGN